MPKPLTLSTPIANIPLVGPKRAKLLALLGISTIEDLLYHFPFRYEDYSLTVPIEFLQPGEVVTIQGKVKSILNEFTRKGIRIQKARVSDQTGTIDVVWYNQPFLITTLRPGTYVSLAGKVDWFGKSIVMESPVYEILNDQSINGQMPMVKFQTIHTGRLVPVYRETRGLSSKWLRSRIAPILCQIKSSLAEFLPDSIITKYQLIPYQQAIEEIHFPSNKEKAQQARRRLAFDELIVIRLASIKRRLDWSKETVGHRFRISPYKKEISGFFDRLPFSLTQAQRRAVGEIFSSLAQKRPMNRLLEGDVGSGKTVVATIAMYIACLNGFQSALMAPTEILAQQHYQTIRSLLEPLGVQIDLQIGSKKTAQTPQPVSHPNILIGTHALISKTVSFAKLGLVVIDEQHRFGVEQRAALRKKGVNPHLLTMTATPIPRTAALTLYGELDLSYLDELPPGRKRVKTWMVSPEKREAAYQWIVKKIKDTPWQAFIICPLIEESETLTSVKAAKKEYERLKNEVFPDLSLALLHGKMKAKEKESTLSQFASGNYHILVSTPVVEVGIDIKNAIIMMIEAADRFGLAELHQLRGRVGRSDVQSYCLLFTDSQKGLERLKNMERIFIGAELAELDLKLRGPGELYGTRQHGMAKLKIASLSDQVLIKNSQQAARMIIGQDATFGKYPLLQRKVAECTIKQVAPD